MTSAQLSQTTQTHAVVIAPSGKTNALGRAMCVADLLSEVFDSVRLYAPKDGPLWPGAKRATQQVRRFGSPTELVAELRHECQAHECQAHWGFGGSAQLECDGSSLFVWSIKPLSSSWGAAQAIRRALPMSVTVLDLDDADEQLSSQFMASSLVNRLRLHPWNPLNPRRIRNTLACALSEADAVTYASETLRDALGFVFDGPALCMPHPRRRTSSRSISRNPSERIDLGFLGTVRQHKGLGDIETLVLEDSRYTLHVFRGALPRVTRERLKACLVEHDVDAPMADLYGEIDVVVLPQDRSLGSQAQLPAKLLDAMRFGKPILASPSTAIVEVAADTVIYVSDWGSLDEVRSKILQASAEESILGPAALRRFEQQLALEAQVEGLHEFIRALSVSRGLQMAPREVEMATGEFQEVSGEVQEASDELRGMAKATSA
jgi:glycosyltransferase involved in cell wall biosynthesis